MFYLRIYILITALLTLACCVPIIPEEDSKHLENPNAYEGRRRHRPSFASNKPAGCNFNGVKGGNTKNGQKGRTFFDFDFFNIGYNYQYNVNCGDLGQGEEGGGDFSHYQGPGGYERPHRPNRPNRPFGGHHNGGHHGNGFWSGFLGPFSQAQSQSGSTSVNDEAVSSDGNPSLANLLPSPQQVGHGLGDGIIGFLQTIPQIGQSFQSLLPNFDNFQWPTLPSLHPLPALSHGQQRYFQRYRNYQNQPGNYYRYQTRNNYQSYNRYSPQRAEPRQYNGLRNKQYLSRADGRSFRFPT